MADVVQRDYPGVHWWCPQLPPSPRAAMSLIDTGIAAWAARGSVENMAVVGSSLGGFYATAVAERMACRAVLLNPAVEPARDLQKYIGEQASWQNPDERFFFEAAYIEELRELYAGPLKSPHNYFALLAKGDEVLDWREMHARYAATTIQLIEGSDHALSDFDQYLPAILDFLDLIRSS